MTTIKPSTDKEMFCKCGRRKLVYESLCPTCQTRIDKNKGASITTQEIGRGGKILDNITTQERANMEAKKLGLKIGDKVDTSEGIKIIERFVCIRDGCLIVRCIDGYEVCYNLFNY